MATLESTSCCGVDEIEGLRPRPEQTLSQIGDEKFSTDGWEEQRKQAFILITDTVESGKGRELVAYIKKHKLGTVVGTKRSKKNPNSGNAIEAWLWSPNERNYRKWWITH